MMVVMVMMMLMMMFVPVMPQLGLVQQEEEHQADQQRHEEAFGTRLALKRFGQQVHKSRGQQGPRSQAEHVLGVARQHAKTQQGSQPHAANASDQCADQNRY